MNKPRLSSVSAGKLIFWMAFFAYAFSYLGRNTFSACLLSMQNAGMFDEGLDGYISAAYLIMYGSGQLINGIVVTKVSPKILSCIGLAGSGLANILMTVEMNQYFYVLFWGLNGYCCAMMWPSVIAFFSRWLNKTEREKGAGDITPSIPIGSIGCYAISFFMLKLDNPNNWRFVFILAGVLLFFGSTVLGVTSFVFGKDIDAKAAQTQALESVKEITATHKNKNAFTLGMIFTTGLFAMMISSFFNGTLKEGVIGYVPTYLSESFGFSSDTSALISILLPVFAVAGPYLGIFLNKKFFDNECTTIGVLMGISAICNFAVFASGSKLSVLAIIMIAVSTACMWGINNQLMTFTPFHFNRQGLSTIVSGILNCTVFIGSAIFTVLYRNINTYFGEWNPVVLVWAIIGAVSCTSCLVFARFWKSHRPD